MSYTFSILSPLDVPLFTHDFGTSRSGGDGVARYTPAERAMVPFILHSSLDIVEEVQWGPSTSSGSAPMYLKHIDKYQNCFVSCWITGGNTRFLLLTRPRDESLGLTAGGGGARGRVSSRNRVLPPVIQHDTKQFWYLSMCLRYMGAEPEDVEGPHWTSSTMSREECRMKGTMARSAGV
jgi:hypothetical protein